MGNSVGTAAERGSTSVKHGGFSSNNLMLEFRKRLLDKFPTIKDAFESFTAEVPLSRDLTKKEWRRIMGKQGFEWSTKEERDKIFEHIDFVNNGHVSLSEFHIAVEAAAPVRNFEGLRRRWLASGYSSMAQAIRHMAENGAVTTRTRLNFYEFSELLKCVNVLEHGEHVSLFNAICSDRHGKTSLGELMSAIATVSPMLLLEDVRWRLLKKYDNDLEKAYFDLDMDHGGSIGWQEFVFQSVRRLGLTETEAKKVFKEIDIDSSGEISRSEFVSAIGLSEPSLFLEDLRLKIRQRFRSIEEAFSKAFRESLTDDLDAQPKIKLPRFQESLLALDLQEAETRTLFELVDADRDGELTVREFLKGVRHFAPSCVLEDLRVRCCQRHKHVCDAFAGVSDDRSTPLSPEAFSLLLESLDLLYPGERKEASWLQESVGRLKVQAIFNLLDVNHEGTASLGRLVAALQSCGAGSNVRLPSEERDLSAKLAIRSDLAPVHRLAGDLKSQVRHGINLDSAADQLFPGGRAPEECIWAKYGANLIEKMLENPNAEAYASSSHGRGGNNREVRHWKYTKTPTAKPRRTSSGASPRRLDGRAASRSNSPEHPHGQEHSRGRTVGLHGGLGGDRHMQKDDRVAAPPRLQTAPSKDFTKYGKPAPHAGRFADAKKPVELCISGTQESWGNVWKHLHSSPWVQPHSKLERDLQVYYQAATSKMSHDMTLMQNTHSRAQLHQSLRQHRRGHTA